jgi:phage shock protein C
MYCTQCGATLSDAGVFCSRCSNRDAVTVIPRSLTLDKRNKKIAGVCAGFARYCGVDVSLMRVIWLAAALGTGVGFLVYLAAWIVLPSSDQSEQNGTIMQAPQRM